MRLTRNIRTVTRIFLIMTILLFPWTVQREVLGAEAGQGNITVQLDNLGTPRDGVKFTAYCVGSRSDEGKWVLEESLTGTGVNQLFQQKYLIIQNIYIYIYFVFTKTALGAILFTIK